MRTALVDVIIYPAGCLRLGNDRYTIVTDPMVEMDHDSSDALRTCPDRVTDKSQFWSEFIKKPYLPSIGHTPTISSHSPIETSVMSFQLKLCLWRIFFPSTRRNIGGLVEVERERNDGINYWSTSFQQREHSQPVLTISIFLLPTQQNNYECA